jgi:hypothetical protein
MPTTLSLRDAEALAAAAQFAESTALRAVSRAVVTLDPAEREALPESVRAALAVYDRATADARKAREALAEAKAATHTGF